MTTPVTAMSPEMARFVTVDNPATKVYVPNYQTVEKKLDIPVNEILDYPKLDEVNQRQMKNYDVLAREREKTRLWIS